jgi:hypothetical protein
MRFGIYVPTFGPYDAETIAQLATKAEEADWEGFFIWDHVLWAPDGSGLADTTVALASA